MNDKSGRKIEWAILIIAVVMVGGLFGCHSCARGQDAQAYSAKTNYLDVRDTWVMRDGNETSHTLKARQVIPPLPTPVAMVRSTNADGSILEVRLIPAPNIAPLVHDKPRKVTNAFWVACPECSVRAIRTPIRIETNGSRTVPDGNIIDRSIHFRCCGQEFMARNSKFVETPIAEEVPAIPAK